MPLPGLSAALETTRNEPAQARAIALDAARSLGARGGEFNSFITVVRDPAPAVERSSDRLLGCVFSAKDNIDVAGTITTCGSKVFADASPAADDAWIVKTLKNAGAQCIGKNNMHEFALGATGENVAYGTTFNPWDPTRGVGGSSGGSASAVALRQVHLSIGTDSGGSVRLPACFSGVVGFKPTPGVLPMDGVAGAAWTIDCLGLFTANVVDLRTIWSALRPPAMAQRHHQRRIGYLGDDSMGRVAAPVWSHYLAAVDALRRGGMNMTPISLPGLGDCPFIAMTLAYSEIASLSHELLRTKANLFDPRIRGLMCLGEIWSSRHYVDAQRLRAVFRQRFAEIQKPFDTVLTPTVAVQPPRIGVSAHVDGDPPTQGLYTLMRFTVAFNVIGYPAISVPSGLDGDGLPTGVQLVGRPGQDAVLLDVARCVETVLGVTPAAAVASGSKENIVAYRE